MSENRITIFFRKKQPLFLLLGSLSSTEKSGRFVVVKSSETSDGNENGKLEISDLYIFIETNDYF
jgi:hypothetical protein